MEGEVVAEDVGWLVGLGDTGGNGVIAGAAFVAFEVVIEEAANDLCAEVRTGGTMVIAGGAAVRAGGEGVTAGVGEGFTVGGT